MTQLYHTQPYLKEIQTKIRSVFKENGKNCIQLEENIFHPHGGGQKGDRGTVIIGNREIKITDTIKDQYSDEGTLLITEEAIGEEMQGKPAVCKLDWEYRYKQMRLHSAVHLHHCLLEKNAGKKLPPPKVSNIEEGFAFNRYETDEITEELAKKANNTMKKQIAEGAEVKIYPDDQKKGFYWWEALGYKIPCGGTHLKDLKEIGDIEFKYSSKKGKPTIKISLKN